MTIFKFWFEKNKSNLNNMHSILDQKNNDIIFLSLNFVNLKTSALTTNVYFLNGRSFSMSFCSGLYILFNDNSKNFTNHVFMLKPKLLWR